MKEKHLFKKPLLERIMEAISNMSRRASAIYLAILSLIFLAGIGMLLVGAIYIPLDGENVPSWSIVLLVVGFFVAIGSGAGVALTTLSSNYVKSRQQQREEELKAREENGNPESSEETKEESENLN